MGEALEGRNVKAFNITDIGHEFRAKASERATARYVTSAHAVKKLTAA
jgi:hypothetical protein